MPGVITGQTLIQYYIFEVIRKQKLAKTRFKGLFFHWYVSANLSLGYDW